MTRLLARLTCLALLAPLAAGATSAAAQDTSQVKEGIRVGLDYNPGVQPGLVVLPGAGLDSVRAIVGRDLDYSDRFRVIILRDVAITSEAAAAPRAGGVNYGIYQTLGAEFGVELTETAGAVTVRLHDLNAGKVRNQQSFALPPATDPGYRLEVHRVADEVARWATGTPGIAASRLLLVSGGRVYRIDSDGEALTPLTPAGQTALSPAWSPDGGALRVHPAWAGRGDRSWYRASGAVRRCRCRARPPRSTSRRRSRPTDGWWPTRTPTRTGRTYTSRTSPIAAARNA